MATEKAPAFQFYPRDWDTDVNVIPMTYEEEGVYWALLRLMWLNESLPANLDQLRMLLKGKPALKRIQQWWDRIGPCFQERNGRLYHRRLEREREAQAESRRRRAEAAAKRWEKDALHQQSISNASAKQCSASASAPSSSTASATAVNAPASNASAAPLITSPLAYERKLQHCAYVGARLEVPKVLHGELRKSLGGTTAEADLVAWYADLDADLEQSGEAIPDVWSWLRARFRVWDVATSRAAAAPTPTDTRAAQSRAKLAAFAAELDARNDSH